MTKNWQGLEQLGDTIKEIDNHIKEKATDLLESGEVPSIKADEIVENMKGYSASIPTSEYITKENIYTGAVKNGNKLTLVSALNITKTQAATPSVTLVSFSVPESIMNKLFPTSIGGYTALDYKTIDVAKSDATTTSVRILILKDTANGKVNFTIQGTTLSNLTIDEKYYCRIEATFLLSDNLIS